MVYNFSSHQKQPGHWNPWWFLLKCGLCICMCICHMNILEWWAMGWDHLPPKKRKDPTLCAMLRSKFGTVNQNRGGPARIQYFILCCQPPISCLFLLSWVSMWLTCILVCTYYLLYMFVVTYYYLPLPRPTHIGHFEPMSIHKQFLFCGNTLKVPPVQNNLPGGYQHLRLKIRRLSGPVGIPKPWPL